MSWTNPVTWLAGQIVTAALLNTHVRDNLNELRGGGIAMSGQDVNDFIHATSATQFGRVGVAGAGGSGRVPTFIAPGWELRTMYPVGSLYFNASDSTNPNTLLGFGTWEAFGAGRVLVGIDPGQAEFDTLGETGGSKTHTLTIAEMPLHTHIQDAHFHAITGIGSTVNIDAAGGSDAIDDSGSMNTGSTTATNQSTGGGGAHNNLPPYITVYCWRRTV